jgi:hypothetical protein
LYVTLAWSEEDRVASMYQASKWDLLIETTQGKERELYHVNLDLC